MIVGNRDSERGHHLPVRSLRVNNKCGAGATARRYELQNHQLVHLLTLQRHQVLFRMLLLLYLVAARELFEQLPHRTRGPFQLTPRGIGHGFVHGKLEMRFVMAFQ